MKRVIAATAALAVLAAVGGCSGQKIVSVSGIVTLNEAPYPNAVVSFQPIGDKDNPNPGRGAAGVTDAQGRFTLVHDGETSGALVGRHRVRIFTKHGVKPPPTTAGEEDDPGVKGDPIPPEWNELSEQEFEVPRGGTTAADFHIVSKKK